MKLLVRSRPSGKRPPRRSGDATRRAKDDFLRSSSGRTVILTTAEVAECTCPDFCERDHETD
jgi:hypothetical protein